MSSTGRELVGVLGGMGPAATADFYAKLIRHTPAIADQDHLRIAIWADPGVPDRVGAVLEGSTDPYPTLLHGATKLASLGSTLVAMPCHTAHFFLPRLVADTGLAFVDMVTETITELSRRGRTGPVGVLATVATVRSELYQQPLAAAGLPVIQPDTQTQHDIDQTIWWVKSGAAETGRPHAQRAVSSLAQAGAETVLLACTELPLALGSTPAAGGPLVIDPTDVLAAAVVRHCRPAE